jgi:FSR family fosmidomycin resistance protein-like MFS transporter
VPAVIAVALAGMILASAFPAMVVYAQDLMPQSTGMVAGLLFGLAFGSRRRWRSGLGRSGRPLGHRHVYRICGFLPLLGLAAFLLPDLKD